ncbi:MAG: flagellar basal body P-ring protein FlgI [Candidatus Sericytochromatia bacterium]
MISFKKLLPAFLISVFALSTIGNAKAADMIASKNSDFDATVRVKDVAVIRNARPNYLSGYGLVVGLQGTGDSNATLFTNKSFANMLERLGIPNMGAAKIKNVAGVLVTAKLPPYVKPGQQIDVEVSAIGDAKSIENGFLARTPLNGPDGRTYAVSQGAVSIGGYGVESDGSVVKKNVPTIGRIPNGALIEKEVAVTMLDEGGNIYIDLINPDSTTASELADKINKSLLGNAKALDPATVKVFVTASYRENIVDLLSRIENLSLSPRNNAAKVILDERTGTIVIGQNVKIGPVAVSHGGLTVKIEKQKDVSQPNPASGGQTKVVENTKITVDESKGVTQIFKGGTTIGELVKSLNVLGVSTKDLITVIQAIKAAGALNAHLEII